MKTATMERWIWILIYAGMLLIALGLAVLASEPTFAAVAMACGGVGICGGIGLIWRRSRIVSESVERKP